MAKAAGRELVIRKDGTAIAAVREKSVTWNGTPIDVTNDDDNAATTYLADEFATTTLEISVSGLADSDILPDIVFGVGATVNSSKHLDDITILLPNGDAVGGTFILTNYAKTGTYNDAVTFTATLVRSGIHTLTAA